MIDHTQNPDSLFGPAYDLPHPFIALPVGIVGKITKLGVSTAQATVLVELVGLSYKNGKTRVSASVLTLANRTGMTRQGAGQALKKAIKLGLIVVVENYDKATKRSRKFNISPLIKQLQLFKKPKIIKKQTPLEPIETKHPMRFGPANLDPRKMPFDPEDPPDWTTEGHKHCGECNTFGAVPCDCEGSVTDDRFQWINEDLG